MKKIFTSLFVFCGSLTASAYIIPTRTILQKTVENSGAGIYAIEQEVQFQNGDDILALKETWLIDSDRTMRLTVTGDKGLRTPFKLQFLYNGGQRWSLVGSNRKNENVATDFLEKYFNFRSAEIFSNTLAHFKIVPQSAYQKKPLAKSNNEYKHDPEPWVRYSRTGGVINYAFGVPTPVDKELNYPGIWIEQDQFVVRKLRLPSQVEVTASDYSHFAKGLYYPRLRNIRWGNNTVTIRLISAAARPQTAVNLFQPSSLDSALKWSGISDVPAKDVITEFYTRFR